ncbi:MAG: type II secretion system protein [Clostridia bacterium]|nr:type II secretion system protein [Clostridia bacterium]
MNLKSQKGYSLIEIGVGILIITVLLSCSTVLFNGCFNIYRAIQQKNYVVSHAISRVEEMLQKNADELLPDPASEEELINIVKSLRTTEEGRKKLAAGEYSVPDDIVEGGFIDSPETNNMRITTKVRRVPSDGDDAYDNTLINISVLVEYTIKPQIPGKEIAKEDIMSYEIGALKVTKS